jgi:type VI secretion system protein ImpL
MFEDVAPGENNEWKEFLKLLRTSRPNCPINGMLLVIPADTLITDKPDEIEKKAGKIAQQFDQIQRSLGVRFPVFVLITKADLINGFREFFDDITDPRLTAQMLGWSNPSDLDEPFKPDRVEDHLDSLRQHLLQRRFGPAAGSDPHRGSEGSADRSGRRAVQVPRSRHRAGAPSASLS